MATHQVELTIDGYLRKRLMPLEGAIAQFAGIKMTIRSEEQDRLKVEPVLRKHKDEPAKEVRNAILRHAVKKTSG